MEELLKVHGQISEIEDQARALRELLTTLRVMLRVQDRMLDRLISSVGAAATHPETPMVVRAMLLHALEDMKAMGQEITA